MTGKILSFADYLRASDEEKRESVDSDRDSFLLEEGLDLLANYRSIHDRAMRMKIKALVEMIARNQAGS